MTSKGKKMEGKKGHENPSARGKNVSFFKNSSKHNNMRVALALLTRLTSKGAFTLAKIARTRRISAYSRGSNTVF